MCSQPLLSKFLLLSNVWPFTLMTTELWLRTTTLILQLVLNDQVRLRWGWPITLESLFFLALFYPTFFSSSAEYSMHKKKFTNKVRQGTSTSKSKRSKWQKGCMQAWFLKEKVQSAIQSANTVQFNSIQCSAQPQQPQKVLQGRLIASLLVTMAEKLNFTFALFLKSKCC